MVYALIGAAVVGLSLGLLGSGGSILTVPVLVYILGHEDKIAIAESLAIVGGIALASALPFARKGLVEWRSVVFFGIPGMLGTYAGSYASQFVDGSVQLVIFAVVMLGASVLMIRGRKPVAEEHQKRRSPALTGVKGFVVGCVTGLVGVGGGFMIVPALVLLERIPMKRAVATSLAIITINSAVGFVKHLGVVRSLGMEVDWTTIGLFLLVGIAGSMVGRAIGGKIDQQALRRVFGVFLVVMAGVILVEEAPRVFGTGDAQTQEGVTNHDND